MILIESVFEGDEKNDDVNKYTQNITSILCHYTFPFFNHLADVIYLYF